MTLEEVLHPHTFLWKACKAANGTSDKSIDVGNKTGADWPSVVTTPKQTGLPPPCDSSAASVPLQIERETVGGGGTVAGVSARVCVRVWGLLARLCVSAHSLYLCPRAAKLLCASSHRLAAMASTSRLAGRILATNTPVMIEMQKLFRGIKDCMSLAQGIVFWQPPAQALEKIKDSIFTPAISNYGPDDGIPELKAALIHKLKSENKLINSSVMVTAGANQAFVSLVLALCDAGDSVVMFVPYYFNAYMSFQMTGVTDILVGPNDPATLQPDADWLEEVLSPKEGKVTPKLVTVVNPGNPSGMCIPHHLLVRLSELCLKAGAWLVVDNTYEYFMFNGLQHSCIEGDHIVNVFSFSKAYGMMGWRIGYIAYPSNVKDLDEQLLKVQDNIPICPSIVGQKLALFSMEVGSDWVRRNVQQLTTNIDIVKDALSPLGKDAVKGGEGAIYLWVKLPEKAKDDKAVVEWLARKHGVMVIPGSASGGQGHIRVSFGGLPEDQCRLAAARLKKGLEQLVAEGLVP